jgi:hypothetical protein
MVRPKAGEVTKADVIRQGLGEHSELGPKDLAEKLNAKVKKEGLGIAEIKPGEISVYRSKAKAKDGSSSRKASSAGKAASKSAAPAGHASVAEVLQTARTLVDQLGKEEAKKVIDLL